MSIVLIIYERGVLGFPRIKPDVLMPSVYMTSPALKGGNTTLVTLVIELLQVMTTFHPNDYFEHVMTTLIQVMTIFVKFYVIL